MAKDICATHDAIDRAIGVNAGLDALVSLLLSTHDDALNSKSIGELLWSIQSDFERHLNDAKAGLRDSK